LVVAVRCGLRRAVGYFLKSFSRGMISFAMISIEHRQFKPPFSLIRNYIGGPAASPASGQSHGVR